MSDPAVRCLLVDHAKGCWGEVLGSASQLQQNKQVCQQSAGAVSLRLHLWLTASLQLHCTDRPVLSSHRSFDYPSTLHFDVSRLKAYTLAGLITVLA